jgi:hypothetical protein
MADPVKTFNQAAEKQDPAIFDYAREVEQVWRDFPETKNTVFFLDISKDELVYPGEQERKEKLIEWINNRSDLQSGIKEYNGVKGSCYQPYKGFGFVLLYTKENRYTFTDRAQEILRIFDHELGHAIIPNAHYKDGKNKAECIADAYSVIRHLQRFGADSTFIDRLVQNRAFHFVFRKGRSTHFTSPVTEQILARRHDIAWDHLTPQETTKLARRFALEYAMHPFLLDSIDASFKEFQGKIDDIQKGDASSLQKLAKEVLSTNGPNFFKYGAMALKFCLDGQIPSLNLTGEYWDNMRRQLAEKQKTFDAQGKLLFGLGAEDRPVQKVSASNVIKFPSPGKKQ